VKTRSKSSLFQPPGVIFHLETCKVGGENTMRDSLEKEEEENTSPLKMMDMVLLFSSRFKMSA